MLCKKFEFLFQNQKDMSSKDVLFLLNFIKESRNKLPIKKHPLGFIYIELCKHETTVFRFHIWTKNYRYTQTPNWPIHNHIYDLESYVIFGKLIQKEYSIDYIEHSNDKYLFRVEYNEYGTIKTPYKPIDINILDENEYIKGDRYYFKKDLFHSIHVNIDDFTATFVRSSNINSLESPLVVGNIKSGQKSIKYFKDDIDPEYICEVMDTLIKHYE